MRKLRPRHVVWAVIAAVALMLVIGLVYYGVGSYDTGDPDQIDKLLTTSTADR